MGAAYVAIGSGEAVEDAHEFLVAIQLLISSVGKSRTYLDRFAVGYPAHPATSAVRGRTAAAFVLSHLSPAKRECDVEGAACVVDDGR